MGGLIAGIVVCVFLAGAGYGIYRYARYRIEKFSLSVFGTKSISDGINRQADLAAVTPKSVNAMTRIFLPQIQKDFPDLNVEEFKHKAENLLVAALNAVNAGNAGLLKEATEDVKQQVKNQIETNRASGMEEVYSRIKIHRTEIANYEKKDGKCIITFQSAVEHMHYKKRGGQVIEGDAQRLAQTKYNVELLYIQDARLAEKGSGIGVTCPNCGAPVTNLGSFFCEFCGTAVTPVNTKVWSLHKYYEVDYHAIH